MPPLFLLDVRDTPNGFAIRPRSAGSAWWIEALVWAFGACCAAALLLQTRFGGLRVLGAVVVVAIGVRALLRILRLVMAGSLRTLHVNLVAPMPSASGPLKTVPLAHVSRFGLSHDAGSLWLCAFDAQGRSEALVEIDRSHAAEYTTLGEWLGSIAASLSSAAIARQPP